ncbi:hypothetical protein D3C81_864290 [compost metagenome]
MFIECQDLLVGHRGVERHAGYHRHQIIDADHWQPVPAGTGDSFEPAQGQISNEFDQRLPFKDVPTLAVATHRSRMNDRVISVCFLHVTDDCKMGLQLAAFVAPYTAVDGGPVCIFRALIINPYARKVGKVLQHIAAHHQQSDTQARRKPGDSQRSLHIDGAGALHCQPPGKLRREVKDHSGRRDAFLV